MKAWARLSPYAKGVDRWVKSGEFSDFDFAGFTSDLLPVVYVEIKKRRVPWGEYGDVIFPHRKWLWAQKAALRNCALVGVTEYACGSIAEVNLTLDPSEEIQLERRDRPGSRSRYVSYRGGLVKLYLPAATGE